MSKLIKTLSTNRRYGIIGTSGTGKSNTTYYLLNELRRQNYPVIVLDHKGEYSGIHGVENIRASEQNPRELPIKLRNSNVSVVIDLRSHENAAWWVGEFITTCLKLPRKVPVLVVIEEAHNYAPQTGKTPPSKTSINRMAAEGRSLGYGLLVITQQLQKIDKTLISQAGALYIHRHQFKTDLSYLSEFLGDEGADKIQRLKTGEIYHIDLETMEVNIFKMPLVKNKIIGGTPQAQPIQANKQAWDQAPFWQTPRQTPPAPANYGDQGGGGSTGLILLSVLAVVVIIAVSVYIYKSWSNVDESLKRADPKGGGLPW